MIKYQLPNGLRIVAEKIPTCRSISFGIWIKTGSRNENEINNGISHFIEHMLFKGTDKYSSQAIAEIFDGIGGNVNAFTSKEYTCFYSKVLDEHLPIAVEVLSDMFFHSRIDGGELKKERNVIMEEISMYEDTPDDLVHDLVAKAAYGNHSLGYTILGTEQNLAQMEPEHLQNYMREYYNLHNTVIGLAGNLKDSDLELIERHFSAFANEGDSVAYEAPEFKGDVVFRSKTTEQNHICLSLPGCSYNDDKAFAMILLNNAIGGGMSSRLFQEIREKRGLAYSIYSYHSSHIDSGLFTVYAGSAPKYTMEVLEVTMDILGELTSNGLSEAELHKGKEQLKGSLILSLESTGSRMNRIGKNELMQGRHFTLDQMIERIEAISMEDIHSLCSSIFKHPFALAMVGQSDKALQGFGRDRIAIQSTD